MINNKTYYYLVKVFYLPFTLSINNKQARQILLGSLICLSLHGDRKEILHYHQFHVDLSSDSLHTSWREHRVTHTPGHSYGDFLLLFFFHPHRELSPLTTELSGGIWSVPFYSGCLHASFTLVIPPLFLLLSESDFLNGVPSGTVPSFFTASFS